MSLTITTDLITSDHSAHTARPVPGHPHAWQVTWLPSRHLDRSTSITAMVLAEAAARNPRPGHRIWPHLRNRAAVLDLTAPQAIALLSRPPGKTSGREPAARPPDREAAGP